MKFFKNTNRQEMKEKARRTLTLKIEKTSKNYVIDTSAIINKFLPLALKKGISGKLIVPNAVMSELENMANKGREEGFIGLEEVAKLHKQKQLKLFFQGLRPNEMQIKFAKSGEIDALIRELTMKTKSTLITSDLVQAKSAQAYGLQVIYLKPKIIPQKKKFFNFFKN